MTAPNRRPGSNATPRTVTAAKVHAPVMTLDRVIVRNSGNAQLRGAKRPVGVQVLNDHFAREAGRKGSDARTSGAGGSLSHDPNLAIRSRAASATGVQ